MDHILKRIRATKQSEPEAVTFIVVILVPVILKLSYILCTVMRKLITSVLSGTKTIGLKEKVY